jgi:hypothetical protein
MRRRKRNGLGKLMIGRRTFMIEMAALAALPFAWRAESAHAATQAYDFSPAQTGRVRAPKDPDAQRLLAGYRLVSPGVLTVAIAPFDPPIATYATDARSVVGADPDYAQLVADALGLRLHAGACRVAGLAARSCVGQIRRGDLERRRHREAQAEVRFHDLQARGARVLRPRRQPDQGRSANHRISRGCASSRVPGRSRSGSCSNGTSATWRTG